MKKLKQMYRCMDDRKHRNRKTTGCPTVLLRVPLGHDRRCGFTLVELVIVIAIVIILSVVSVPIYRGYVDKAKLTEGYALLGVLASAQKAYFTEHGNYLRRQEASEHATGSGSTTCYEPIFGIDARNNKYFTLFSVNDGGTYSTGYFCVKVYPTRSIGIDNIDYLELLRNGTTYNCVYK